MILFSGAGACDDAVGKKQPNGMSSSSGTTLNESADASSDSGVPLASGMPIDSGRPANAGSSCEGRIASFMGRLAKEPEVAFDGESRGHCKDAFEGSPPECGCSFDVNGVFWGQNVSALSGSFDGCAVNSPRTGFCLLTKSELDTRDVCSARRSDDTIDSTSCQTLCADLRNSAEEEGALEVEELEPASLPHDEAICSRIFRMERECYQVTFYAILPTPIRSDAVGCPKESPL